MSELTIKQPSKKLKQKLDEVVTHFRNAATLVNEVFTLGREEGFSEKEIGQMIRDRLVQLGYNPRSIRRVLPSSAKDLTKVRKENLVRDQENNDSRSDEDIMSSYESRNEFDENQQAAPYNNTHDYQMKIKILEEQLAQERYEKEDLQIQCKNATYFYSELRTKLKDVVNATGTLVITKDNFPPDSNRVFSSEDHVFAVKFKGTLSIK